MVWAINFDRLSGFQSLLQTEVSQGSDGQFFVRSDGGIGVNGDWDCTISANTWFRIGLTVEERNEGTSMLTKFLDGALLDIKTVEANR